MHRWIWIAGLVAPGCGVEVPEAELDTGVSWLEAPALDRAAGGTHRVWLTCGDPVCSGWSPKGLPDCPMWATEGMACPPWADGRRCDPHDACNALYICDDVDPTAGGCPISLRSAKSGIDYVDPAERQALHDALMDFNLATYRYRADGATGPQHLGFIIDDVAPSPAIAASGQRVDLYAYASMAVAALQVQQEQIETLQAQLQQLQAQLAERPPEPR